MKKAGDIIKMKYAGAKRKFRILGPTDVITKGCLQQYVTEVPPLCYDTVINMANYNYGNWSETMCEGDLVCDDHFHRVYLQPVPWN